MKGQQFDSSDDPVFETRIAAMSQAATVRQQAADASDGGTTRASTPEGDPGGDDPGAIEQIADDLGAAAEAALLAAMAAAAASPPVAAATAIIDQAEDLLDAGNEAAKAVGGVLDDIFGGEEEHSGESTFDTPSGPPETQEENDARAEANLAAAQAKAAARQAEVDMRESLDDAKHQKIQDVNGDRATLFTDAHHQFVGDLGDEISAGAVEILTDEHHQFVDDLQGDVTRGATDRDLPMDSAMYGHGAGGLIDGAPDGVLQPVDELRPNVAIGADPGSGAVDGAPDGVYEPVTESSSHTTIGTDLTLDNGIVGPGATGGTAVGAPDDVMEPVAGLSSEVAIGADPGSGAVDGAPDVSLNPQPIPPGMDLHPPSPIAVAGADVSLNPQPIPPGMDLHPPSPIAVAGADVSLNPQPIPPGMDLHPPSPIAVAGADVSLNPQPIPPGMGADIGEPMVSGDVDNASSVADSSIIIVGGTEAPMLHGSGAGGDLGEASGGALGSLAGVPDHIDIGSVPDIGAIVGTETHFQGDGVAADSAPLSGAPDGVVGNVDDARPEVSIGADIDVGPGPNISAAAAQDVAPGEDIGLNPQPIPPGIGADIGEPVADATADHAPSIDDSSIIFQTEAPLLTGDADSSIIFQTEAPLLTGDADSGIGSTVPSGDFSSIIIVGGSEAPMLAGDAADDDPVMQDVASAIADGGDGPSFSVGMVDDQPVDVGITENDFDT